MSENPFDVGEAGKPVDTGEFDAARQAWEADRDRIAREVLPAVDAAIAEARSWAGVVDNLVVLVNELVPVLERLGEIRAVGASNSTGRAIEQLVALRAAICRWTGKCG